MQKVVAVIVTYNRLSKLKYALECYDKQTIPFHSIIVVDNNSTDGTIEYLKEWETQRVQYDKYVLYLDTNKGGSGGFFEGEKYAMELNPDWIYIADDDAYPEIHMVEKFQLFYKQHSTEKIAAICTSVWDMTNSIMYYCRSHTKFLGDDFVLIPSTESEYKKSYFEFNCLSYVGAFISTSALVEFGLVNKDFFIYQDDVEHSIRINKFGKMYCVPSMKIVHDSVPSKQMTDEELSKILWKEYYAIRNRNYMLLKHKRKIGIKSITKQLGMIRSRRENTLSPYDRMVIEGCKDALFGNLGIHLVYKPGLNVNNVENLPYPKFLWTILYWIFRFVRIFKK